MKKQELEMTKDIGKIAEVGLREIWNNEATDFTPWLEENIDVLGDELGFEIINVQREQSAGDFSVDLLAEDKDGNPIVIENQLEKSDHDHLGKLITYLSYFEAKKAIWIVSKPRPEHSSAINWLNNSTDCDFYLVQIEAIRIDDSKPAPRLTLIAGSNEVSKEVRSIKKSLSIDKQLKLKFWESLLKSSNEKIDLFKSAVPTHGDWKGSPKFSKGISYVYAITKSTVKIILYIDVNDVTNSKEENRKENRKIFHLFKENKETIEKEFGNPLVWDDRDKNISCQVRKEYHIGGWESDEEQWTTIFDTVTTGMQKLESTFKPYIANID